MTLDEYVRKRHAQGCKIADKSCNGIDYLYIFEADGWITVLSKSDGGYRAKIQAKDEKHADNYILMIEAVPFACQKL